MPLVVQDISPTEVPGTYRVRLSSDERDVVMSVRIQRDTQSTTLEYDEELRDLLVQYERHETALLQVSRYMGEFVELMTKVDAGRDIGLPFTVGSTLVRPRARWWRFWE